MKKMLFLVAVLSLAWASPGFADGASPVEAETFNLPTGVKLVNDSQYSGGKAIKITNGQAVATKSITISERSDVYIMARGKQAGGSPTLTLRVDGVNKGTKTLGGTLQQYTYLRSDLEPGTYTIGLKGGNINKGRHVFVDVLTFPADSIEPPPDTTPPNTVDAATWPESGGTVPVGRAWEVAFRSRTSDAPDAPMEEQNEVTYECQLDGGPWEACEDNVQLGDLEYVFYNQVGPDRELRYVEKVLPAGTHTFSVRATDAAGNLEPVPWTMQAVFASE